MSQKMTVTYYHHSGFSVASGNILLVFDYWQGLQHKMPVDAGITPEVLSRYEQVYVFVTHEHEDHLDPVIFTWEQYAPVTYILADTVPEKYTGRRMAKGGELVLSDGLKVKAFGSTDSGVSYLVMLNSVNFFHAGDLNFWHWSEVSDNWLIKEAEDAFKAEIADLVGASIDLAFFPVDPRLGKMFEAGANYFALTVKPRILMPMHFWGRREVMKEYARRCRTRETEIIALTEHGEAIDMVMDEEGRIDVTYVGGMKNDAGQLYGDDPFIQTDLPINL